MKCLWCEGAQIREQPAVAMNLYPVMSKHDPHEPCNFAFCWFSGSNAPIHNIQCSFCPVVAISNIESGN